MGNLKQAFHDKNKTRFIKSFYFKQKAREWGFASSISYRWLAVLSLYIAAVKPHNFFQPVGIHFAFKMVSGVRVPGFSMKTMHNLQLPFWSTHSLTLFWFVLPAWKTYSFQEMEISPSFQEVRICLHLHIGCSKWNVYPTLSVAYFVCLFWWIYSVHKSSLGCFFLEYKFKKNINYEQLSSDCIRKISK